MPKALSYVGGAFLHPPGQQPLDEFASCLEVDVGRPGAWPDPLAAGRRVGAEEDGLRAYAVQAYENGLGALVAQMALGIDREGAAAQ